MPKCNQGYKPVGESKCELGTLVEVAQCLPGTTPAVLPCPPRPVIEGYQAEQADWGWEPQSDLLKDGVSQVKDSGAARPGTDMHAVPIRLDDVGGGGRRRLEENDPDSGRKATLGEACTENCPPRIIRRAGEGTAAGRDGNLGESFQVSGLGTVFREADGEWK